MKKNKLLVLLIITIFVLFCSCKEKDVAKIKVVNYSSKIVLLGHFVPDTNTAVKIAEVIWQSNFGDFVLRQRPYEVKLEMATDTIWHIKGTAYFSEDPNTISLGGVAYLSIRSRDCKILDLSHSE